MLQVIVLDIMLGQHRLIERPLDPPDAILGLCMVGEAVVAYNSHYWRRFSLKGKFLEEEYFSVALPVILDMVFLDVDTYIAIFWSGDFEYEDKRIEILYSKNREKSEVICGQQAFCLSINDQDKAVVYIAAAKEKEDNSSKDKDDEDDDTDGGYEILKYVLVEDQFESKGQVAESEDEIFQLCQSGDGKDLIATIVEGFLIWPLAHGGVPGLARLLLPTEFRNVISRPSGSNCCVLNKAKDVAVAGVREYIFVWNIDTEQLLKHFQGHYGRIIR